MSTLGQKPATTHVSLQKQTITGDGGTSYTLQQSVGSALDVAVFINNTRQEPTTAYSASGTTLTMTGAVNSSDHFYVIFLGKAITTTGLPVDSVATANINASAVTDAKIAGMAATKLTGTIASARLPSGSILQVQEGGRTDRFTGTGGTSFADCGVSVAITPSSTSSKILVRVSGSLGISGGGTLNGVRALVKLFRDSTEIGSGTSASTYNVFIAALPLNSYDMYPFSQSTLDSPSTTSSITYKIQIASSANQCVIGGRGDDAEIAVPTRIQVMEIAG